MGIDSTSPKIAMLRIKVESAFGKSPKVHNEFIELSESVGEFVRQHISETTLERVWGYTKRRYDNVSFYTLDLLSRYAGYDSWDDFCNQLQTDGIKDSDMFEGDVITSLELEAGDRLELGWLPDRECIVEYLGRDRFKAIRCKNSTMREGDTFSCLKFILHRPAIFDYYIPAAGTSKDNLRYVAGIKNGLTKLKKL